MADYQDILKRAIQIRDAVLEGTNTASLVGGVMVDTLYLSRKLETTINQVIKSIKELGGSGGTGGGSIDENTLAAYLINNGYAKLTDIPSSWWGQTANANNVVQGSMSQVLSLLFTNETIALDGIANEDTPTDSKTKIVTPNYVNDKFIPRKEDANVLGSLTFDKIQKFLQGFRIGNTNAYSIDANGNVTINLLNSADYDDATQSGFGFYKRKDGKYGLNVTDLSVWGKAMFNNLTIRELTYVGGNLVFSNSAGKIFEVREITDDNGEVTGWKCYLLADDGTTATTNMWEKYDQVKCETFNIQAGVYENVSNKYYWRLVTDVSTENEVITDAEGNVLYDGKKYAWIIISATDKDIGSDNPAAGDTIVLMGNRTNTNRMSFVVKETYGDNAPREVGYTNVHSYTLGNGNLVYEISPKKVRFYSQYFELVTVEGKPIKTINYRGDWKHGDTYVYYDQVTHNGTTWLCVAPEGTEVTSEPARGNDYWKAQNAILDATLSISQSTGEWIDKGETNHVVCSVIRGFEDITDQVTSWNIVRDSGDAVNDAAWQNKDKVKNFDGTIDIAWTDEEDDIGDSTSCIFTITAFWGNKVELAKGTISV